MMDGLSLNELNNTVSGLNSIFHVAATQKAKLPSTYRNGIEAAAKTFKRLEQWTNGINKVTAVVGLVPILQKMRRAQQTNDQELMTDAIIELAVLAVCYVSFPAGALNYVLCLTLGNNWINDLIVKSPRELMREVNAHVGIGFNALANPYNRYTHLTGVLLFYPGTLKLKMYHDSHYDRGTHNMRRPDPYIQVWTYNNYGAHAVSTKVQWNIKETLSSEGAYYQTTGFKPICLLLGSLIKRVEVLVKEYDTFSKDDVLGRAVYPGSQFGLGNQPMAIEKTMKDNDVIAFDMRFVWRPERY